MPNRITEKVRNFIQNLSGRLHLDVGYFLRGGLWLSIPFLVNYALGVLRTVAFARFIDVSTYGKFTWIIGLSGTLSVLTLPGINIALTETVARGNHGSMIDAALARLRWGLLSSLAMVGAALYYSFYKGDTTMMSAILIASAFIPLNSALQVVQGFYNGRKRFDKLSLMTIAVTITSTTILVIVMVMQKGLLWLTATNCIAQVIVYGLFYREALNQVRDSPRDPHMLAYGKSLTWANAISSIAFEMDSVILGVFSGFGNVAIYNIASVLPESLKYFIKMLSPLTLPKIAENPDKKIYTPETRKKLIYLLAFNILFVLVGIIIIPFIITILYTHRYDASIGYAQWLMISLVFGWPGSFFDAALQARKQSRSIYTFNIIYGLLQVGTLIIFVPIWGILGIVFSRIVTRLGSAIYQWYAVSKI